MCRQPCRHRNSNCRSPLKARKIKKLPSRSWAGGSTPFGLAQDRGQSIVVLIQTRGVDYVLAKITLVESKPCRNIGASLMAALKEDWQRAKKFVPKKKAVTIVLAPIAPEASAEDLAKGRLAFKAIKAQIRGGPRDDSEPALPLGP